MRISLERQERGQFMTAGLIIKPPYHVPSMAETHAIPWNGYKVISTFSGCGGSSLGYRMAGFRVIWANEFVPAAQDSYRANMTDDTILDERDIRQIKPEEILKITGLRQGDLDLFDGSPPCQAFSTAGQREKGWGRKRRYEHGAAQCNEQLFSEYIRILCGLMPKTFIAENVSGLVKGTAKGWFIKTLREMKLCGYRVAARLLDAQWLGVPQKRQRIIFIGARDDLKIEPVFPMPLPYRYSVRDALPWIQSIRQADVFDEGDRITSQNDVCPTISARGMGAAWRHSIWVDAPVVEMIIGNNDFEPYFGAIDAPCPTIMSSGARTSGELRSIMNGQYQRRKFTIAELKRICAFPDDFVLTGTDEQQWERLGNAVPPLMMRAIAETIRDKVLRAS